MLHRLGFAILSCLFLVLLSAPAMAVSDSYEYITAEKVKTKLESNAPMHLVDIQVKEDFDQHHLPGAIATYSYPVKSQEDKAKLDAIIEKLQADDAPVVVVCPRGGGGAKRCYDYLSEKGIAKERLLILEKGQEGWPFEEFLESN
ncbi:ThiF [Desulfosarcina cetonica]|uniref:rhodanese-like domain-containing protein n=1 Tax=Desulfosarcina cetonica TaxID=90730 RepID=UPI0006D13C7F|nr:rhodanese-like domain-containing protein [Desulfosarcina cetonica]VTR65475.1 ThiF [Desulfosarcina cetonica]